MERTIRVTVLLYALWLCPGQQCLGQGVDSLLKEYARFSKRGGDPTTVNDVAVPPSAPFSRGEYVGPRSPGAETTVCRCQGYKEHLCLCLKAGVKCHCSRTVGSVWAVNEQGRATHKTGAKADPRQAAAVNRNTASSAPEAGLTPKPPASDDTVPTLRTDGRYWWHDGERWWNTTTVPAEGREFNGGSKVFVFSGGKMTVKGSQMAVQVQQPTGRWVKRCYGGYCRMEWVPN